MKRAIIYARVSTDDQAEKGYSLPTQLEAMRIYAEANGMKVVRELQDDISGAKLDRPALDTLRAMLERKEADAVIVYAADRLSRNLAHLLILREEFNRAGVELHYANRGKSQDTAESRLTENIEGVIAEFEREKIRERTRRGRVAKAKAGKWVGCGSVAYPFRKVGERQETRLEIDQEQAAVMRRIVDMLLGRNGYMPTTLKAIAKQLTDEGVPTPRAGAKGWWTGTIHGLLQGKAILGIFESMGITIEYPELAVIDRATYDEVQAKLERNRRLSARNRKFPYLLSGFGKCVCGLSLAGGRRMYRAGRYYHYYICPAQPSQPHLYTCRERSINVEILEPLIWNWLTSLLSDETKLEIGLREMLANRESELGKLGERRGATEKLIRRAERQIEQLLADLREIESESARAAIKKEINMTGKQKDALLEELRGIDAELSKREITDVKMDMIRAHARAIRAKLAGKLTYEEKRALFVVLDLQFKLQHNETGREVYVQCGLKLDGETVALKPRLNCAVKTSEYWMRSIP